MTFIRWLFVLFFYILIILITGFSANLEHSLKDAKFDKWEKRFYIIYFISIIIAFIYASFHIRTQFNIVFWYSCIIFLTSGILVSITLLKEIRYSAANTIFLLASIIIYFGFINFFIYNLAPSEFYVMTAISRYTGLSYKVGFLYDILFFLALLPDFLYYSFTVAITYSSSEIQAVGHIARLVQVAEVFVFYFVLANEIKSMIGLGENKVKKNPGEFGTVPTADVNSEGETVDEGNIKAEKAEDTCEDTCNEGNTEEANAKVEDNKE